MKKAVIKLGGASLGDPATIGELIQTVREARERGFDVILVHGGGPEINRALTERGLTWQFINGQRQTTPEMMDVIEDVLGVRINSRLVAELRAAGIPARGFSGARDAILECERASAELMQVGAITRVDLSPLIKALSGPERSVAVVAPLGFGAGGEFYNINADWAASRIAMAWGAERLIFLTDQRGILGPDREPLRSATPANLKLLIADGVIAGGMLTKVNTMMAALEAGVREVRVLAAAEASRSWRDANIGTRLGEDGARFAG